jgi:polyisoprenoid-binding protein YceI
MLHCLSVPRLLRTTLLILATPLLYAQQKLTLDPAHSEIHFTVDTTLHTVHGAFTLQPAEIAFDPATGTASGTIEANALSGQSGDSARDRRMSDEILKAPIYKTIAFAPASFTGAFNPAGDSTLQVHGTFTLLGKPHEITVPMKLTAAGATLHATGTFSIPYIQWGLKDPSTFVFRVKKEVQIDLVLTGTLHPWPTTIPPPPH